MLLRAGGRARLLRDGSRLLVAAIGARVDCFARALFDCGLVPVTRAVIAATFQSGPSNDMVGRVPCYPSWRKRLAMKFIAAAPVEMLSGPVVADAPAISPLIEAIRAHASVTTLRAMLRRLPDLDLEWRAEDGTTALSMAEQNEHAGMRSDSVEVAQTIRISLHWLQG